MTEHFGTRAQRPKQPVQWLTEEDKFRLINIGLSLILAFAIAFIVSVTFFRSIPT